MMSGCAWRGRLVPAGGPRIVPLVLCLGLFGMWPLGNDPVSARESPLLQEVGLTPEHLLDPANEERFRLIYNAYLDFAEARLAAGLVPWPRRRRLGCS